MVDIMRLKEEGLSKRAVAKMAGHQPGYGQKVLEPGPTGNQVRLPAKID